MMNGQKIDFEKRLANAFDAGFANATRSLALLTRNRVVYHGFHSEVCRLNNLHLTHDIYKRHNEGSRVLLTTDIFGDLSGKSYLFLSSSDYTLLTHSIPNSAFSVNLREEFLKELDNILSAAVITKISNELNKRMFGNIPIMVGETKSRLENIIKYDFLEQAEQLYINSVSFSFESHTNVQPLFLWAIDYSRVMTGLIKQY
jgi:hypothetical protein